MSIQLELGKTYLNRKGERVKTIQRTEGDDYPWPWVSDLGNSHRDNGCWNQSDHPNDLDLIEEVRQYHGQPHLDSCKDDVAYAALFAEARMKEVQS